MRYVYLIKRENDREIEIAFTKKSAIEDMKHLAYGNVCVWVDRLPRALFTDVTDVDHVESVFDNINCKEIEAVASMNWD